MEDILKRIFIENIQMIRAKKLIKRNIHIPETENINILSGIRRSGKTFRLYQECREMDEESILFMDFEDKRLIHITQLNNYDIILDSFDILHSMNEMDSLIQGQYSFAVSCRFLLPTANAIRLTDHPRLPGGLSNGFMLNTNIRNLSLYPLPKAKWFYGIRIKDYFQIGNPFCFSMKSKR